MLHTGLAAAGRFAAYATDRRLMAEGKRQDKRKPLGRALPRTDEQLDALAAVTDADLDRALAEAESDTRALLEAKPEEEASE